MKKTICKIIFIVCIFVFIANVHAMSSTNSYHIWIVNDGENLITTEDNPITNDYTSWLNNSIVFNTKETIFNSLNVDFLTTEDVALTTVDLPITLNGNNNVEKLNIQSMKLIVSGTGSLKFIPVKDTYEETNDINTRFVNITDVSEQKEFVSKNIQTNLPITYEGGYVYINKIVNLNKISVKSLVNLANGVNIVWNKDINAQGYNIYRKDGKGKYKLIKTINNNNIVSFNDKSVKKKNGKIYTYAVRGYYNNRQSTYKELSIVRLTTNTLKNVKKKNSSSITVNYAKNSSSNGYQVQYSLTKDFSSKNKTIKVSNVKTLSKVIKIAKGKKYYIRVRSYKKVKKVNYYSDWSNVKTAYIASKGDLNAVKEAKSYLRFIAFSKKGLYNQLLYEKYTKSQALYGVEHCGADWKKQSVKKAKSYLNTKAFSEQGLYEQLLFEGFTSAEAKYGVSKSGANWYVQALREAKSYLKYMSFSKQGLYEQLLFEKYTDSQATYAVNKIY